jgi:hypothetical protein
LATFERSFVYDERVLFYLRDEIEKILEMSAGSSLNQYFEELSNLATKLEKGVPVYDG